MELILKKTLTAYLLSLLHELISYLIHLLQLHHVLNSEPNIYHKNMVQPYENRHQHFADAQNDPQEVHYDHDVVLVIVVATIENIFGVIQFYILKQKKSNRYLRTSISNLACQLELGNGVIVPQVYLVLVHERNSLNLNSHLCHFLYQHLLMYYTHNTPNQGVLSNQYL